MPQVAITEEDYGGSTASAPPSHRGVSPLHSHHGASPTDSARSTTDSLSPPSPVSTLGRSPKDRFGFFRSNGELFPHEEVESRMPAKVVLSREKKWRVMLEDYDSTVRNHYKKLKERCRKGIPMSMRPLAWQYISASHWKKNSSDGLYDRLVAAPISAEQRKEIDRDLARSYPTHEMFYSEGPGQNSLKNVLCAYVAYRPVPGFCQAHAPLAALLLMQMPEEAAFWLFVALCEDYLPGYFSDKLEKVQLDGEILFGLLKKVKPKLHHHFVANDVPPVTIMLDWFMCIFGRSLPWPTVLRVWDLFLFEGVIILFKVALVILMHAFKGPLPNNPHDTQEVVQRTLRNLPKELVEENFLVSQVLKLTITKKEFEVEHQRQLLIMRESQRGAANGGRTGEGDKNDKKKGRSSKRGKVRIGPESNGAAKGAEGNVVADDDMAYREDSVFMSHSRQRGWSKAERVPPKARSAKVTPQ